MLANDYMAAVEQRFDDPAALGDLRDQVAKDGDVSDMERQRVLDRIALYNGESELADPLDYGGPDDEGSDTGPS